ncbi:sodium:calcium antiporter [Patescibacteria group bacterium]|nr:sodium:calcium antiporter [Patescibacteria group bacterium]
MAAYLIKFFFGVIILLLSTQIFVKLAVKLSEIFRLSPLIIGLTIMSLGTSLPEIAVSSISSSGGDTGLATGNIIGSNIINVFLIFGIGILVGKLRIGTTKTQKNIVILLIATLFFVFSQAIFPFPRILGTFLLLSYIAFTYMEYKWGIMGRVKEDLAFITSLKKRKISPDLVLGIIFSVFGVGIGGLLVVNSMQELALISGYSTTLFGLTLISVATSLPELFTTIQSQKEDEEKMTIGNLLGSSLFNLLFIGGLANILGGSMELPMVEICFLIISSIFFFVIVSFYKGRVVPKWVGMILIATFFIYIYVLSFTTFGVLSR